MGTDIISKKLSRTYLEHFDLAPIYAEKMERKGYQVYVHPFYSGGKMTAAMVDVYRKR